MGNSREIIKILKMAWPIILGNLSQMAINITDAMIVGRLGYRELAASSLINNILSIPMVALMGLASVMAPMIADFNARNRKEDSGKLLSQGLIAGTSITVFILIAVSGLQFLLDHLNQDPEVVELGRPYLSWMSWSILPMMVFYIIKQFYDGLEKMKIPMIFSIAAILMNLFLNLGLVFGNFGLPAWGLEGSGMATFLTRTILMASLLGHLYYSGLQAQYRVIRMELDLHRIREFLKLALPSGWQAASEVAAFSVLAVMVGWFGAKQLAAHHIAISIATATYMVSLGLSSAGAIRIAHFSGLGDRVALKSSGGLVILTALAYSVLTASAILLSRNTLPHLFTLDESVISIAALLLTLASAFQISDALQAVGIGLLRGMQDIKIPTLITTVAYWFVGIPAGYILSVWMKWEAMGIWIGFVLCLSFSAVLLIRRFLRITGIKNEN